MVEYDSFARFYDELMDESAEANAERIRAAIGLYLPSAQSALELGCGTGAVLAHLTDLASLTGLDRSSEMLALAAEKVPKAHLVKGDMADFDLSTRFDVVICVYDTLNHLSDFHAWLQLFRSVRNHLADGGVFIFDVNTVGRLRQLGAAQPWVHDFSGGTMIMDVAWSEETTTSTWDIRVFEPTENGLYTLHHERITELGVPLAKIKQGLTEGFSLLCEEDPTESAPTDDSARAYFVYRRQS